MTATADVPTGLKLSLLWLFAILNIIFRDIHELLTADTIEGILIGLVNGVEMSEGLLLFGAFVVEPILLGFLLSGLLRPKAARRLNLALVPLAVIVTLAIGPGDPDDYVFAGIEIATFCVIFLKALRWKV